MGFFWVIVSWGIVFWIMSVQNRKRNEQAQAMRRAQAEYAKVHILECFSRMLAFISKADGRISECEVNVASQCLKSLGITESEYRKCVDAFNGTRDFSFGAFRRHAAALADIATSEVCTLVYEMLWAVAAADGVLAEGEDNLLRRAVEPLRIDGLLYHYLKRRYFSFGTGGAGERSTGNAELEKAYARLGCSPSDSDDVVRSAYRKAAMRYHPDRLRAEGLPEGMISQATRSMAEINAAWDVVKKERKFHS